MLRLLMVQTWLVVMRLSVRLMWVVSAEWCARLMWSVMLRQCLVEMLPSHVHVNSDLGRSFVSDVLPIWLVASGVSSLLFSSLGRSRTGGAGGCCTTAS